MSRRETLRIALAATAMLLVTSCGVFRRSDDAIDKAFASLRSTLDEIAADADQQDRLVTIAEQIETACRDLNNEHDAFVEQFEGKARQRDTSSPDLERVVEKFAAGRTEQRNRVLELQDELRAELTEQEWMLAIEALNQTQEATARQPIGSS